MHVDVLLVVKCRVKVKQTRKSCKGFYVGAQVHCAVGCWPLSSRQKVENTVNLDTKITLHCWIASDTPPAPLWMEWHGNTRQIGAVCGIFLNVVKRPVVQRSSPLSQLVLSFLVLFPVLFICAFIDMLCSDCVSLHSCPELVISSLNQQTIRDLTEMLNNSDWICQVLPSTA